MAPVDLATLQFMLESALELHGHGTMYALLEALGRAHCIRLEMTKHGCFAKAFYAKRDVSSSCSTRFASPHSRESLTPATPIGRSTILSMRPRCPPPGLCERTASSPLRCINLFDISADDGAATEATDDQEVVSIQGHNVIVKNTFIEAWTDEETASNGNHSAPELLNRFCLDTSRTLQFNCPCDSGTGGASLSDQLQQQVLADAVLDESVVTIQRMFRGWKGRRRAATTNLIMMKLLEVQSTVRDMNNQLLNHFAQGSVAPALLDVGKPQT